MKRILVPTDFSEPSLRSYKFAVDLAATVGGEVFVVHVIELPLLQETTFGIQPFPRDAESIERQEQKAVAAFERFAGLYPAEIAVQFKPVRGDIIPSSMSYIEEQEIDLVVIATHGSTASNDFFVGETAGKIARTSPVPVITIPREISLNSIKNIVLPNTLEPNQDDFMAHVKELQHLFSARLHVLLVNTPSHFFSDEQAGKKLQAFAEHHALGNYTLNLRNDEQEARGIMSFMNEITGDMLAMPTHGRTGVAHLIKGSIAETLVYGGDYPVWTLKMKTRAK